MSSFISSIKYSHLHEILAKLSQKDMEFNLKYINELGHINVYIAKPVYETSECSSNMYIHPHNAN